MKPLFRADPSASLEAAQTALAQAHERIAQLVTERAAKLEAEGDTYVNDVAKIDAEISRLRASIAVHQARVIAMQSRAAEQQIARLEQDKAAGIAEVRKLFDRRLEAARKLDAAHLQIAKAFAVFMETCNDVKSGWPATCSPLGLLAHFDPENLEPLSSHIKQRPIAPGPVRALAESASYDFAGTVERLNSEALELVEGVAVELPEEIAA